MAYASPAEMLKRFDARDIGDLVSDDGTQVDAAGLLSDANLSAALDDASGEIDAAVMAGGRYDASDMAALTGNALAWLERLTCHLAMTFLLLRRPNSNIEAWEKQIEWADKQLERLRKGQTIFVLPDQVTAGMPTIDGPTTLAYQDLNLWRDRTTNYYPGRVLPANR